MRGRRSPQLGGLARFCACLVLLQSSAWGAPTTDGFALNRYHPSEAGSDWFENESLDLRGGVRPALALLADFSYRPLVLLGADGAEVVPIVDDQFFYHLGAGLVLGRRLRLSASLPLLLHSQGGSGTLAELGGVQGVRVSSSDGAGIGDPRFGADLRLLGEYGGPFSLAVGARVFAALGQEAQFTTDGQARFEGRLMWAGQPGWFAYAAHLGALVHTERDDFAGVPFGTDLTFGAGVALRLAGGRINIGPEIYGLTVVSDYEEGLLKRDSTPVEALLGGKFHVADAIRLGAAGGMGLTQGIGAPKLRVVASLEWVPRVDRREASVVLSPPTPGDLDGDGVSDEWDVCPNAAGLSRPLDRARNGCPDPVDGDGDGIVDAADACRTQSGVPSADPASHGCPPPDRDGDGLVDAVDACPDAPGVQSLDLLHNGCPADSDGDAITDAQDACPGVAGEEHGNPKQHGCPKARIERGEIKINEQVKFATASATILPESNELLQAVADIMVQHPEIELLSVEGHTDASGSARTNSRLSRERALAVVKWLTRHGVSARRLTSRGYGFDRPIDSNDSDSGRKNNRRVEFRITERAP